MFFVFAGRSCRQEHARQSYAIGVEEERGGGGGRPCGVWGGGGPAKSPGAALTPLSLTDSTPCLTASGTGFGAYKCMEKEQSSEFDEIHADLHIESSYGMSACMLSDDRLCSQRKQCSCTQL